MRASTPSMQPPRWTRALLLLALPSDPMRDSILGDLHEEFAHDVLHVGVRQGHLRHVRRTAGIVAHALADSVIWRRWVSREPAAVRPRPSVFVRARGVGGDAGFVVLAAFVLGVGIVINTMLFSAAEPQGPRTVSAAGVGGVALMVACTVVAAILLCAGPRWRRKRTRGTGGTVSS